MTAPKATDSPVIVQYGGADYKVPPSDSWPSDALEVLFEGNAPKAARLILGESWMQDYVARANGGGIERVLV